MIKDSSPFTLESPTSLASTAKPNYRIMVEVSMKKGRRATCRVSQLLSFLQGQKHWKAEVPRLPPSEISPGTGQYAVS
jgi:hypothetical protein